MLPNVEISSAANAGGLSPGQKTEATKATQSQDVQATVKSAQDMVSSAVQKAAADKRADRVDTIDLKTQPSRETPATQKTANATKPSTRKYEKAGTKDQAEINFQVTREERDALVNYVSGKEDVKDMTEDEQETLQKVSERIQKMIENAEAKSTERGERLDKAVKEWYNRLTNGKDKAPINLTRLITLAAMGITDLSKID